MSEHQKITHHLQNRVDGALTRYQIELHCRTQLRKGKKWARTENGHWKKNFDFFENNFCSLHCNKNTKTFLIIVVAVITLIDSRLSVFRFILDLLVVAILVVIHLRLRFVLDVRIAPASVFTAAATSITVAVSLRTRGPAPAAFTVPVARPRSLLLAVPRPWPSGTFPFARSRPGLPATTLLRPIPRSGSASWARSVFAAWMSDVDIRPATASSAQASAYTNKQVLNGRPHKGRKCKKHFQYCLKTNIWIIISFTTNK